MTYSLSYTTNYVDIDTRDFDTLADAEAALLAFRNANWLNEAASASIFDTIKLSTVSSFIGATKFGPADKRNPIIRAFKAFGADTRGVTVIGA